MRTLINIKTVGVGSQRGYGWKVWGGEHFYLAILLLLTEQVID